MFVEKDISKKYLDWLNDKLIMRYGRQSEKSHSRVSELVYLESFAHTENRFLAVDNNETGKMIGTMTVYVSENHGAADIGILIGDVDLWGKGFGYDAWSTTMRYLSELLGIRKITGCAVSINSGMIKIMERAGMHLDTTRTGQRVIDEVLYAKFV
jgi:ribosomal-protein-alanine N-acetyltransferase